MPIAMRQANTDRDLQLIQGLLAKCQLPPVAAILPENYFVVTVDGKVVACAGLEVYGRTGLVRSLAVDPAERKRGFGANLVARLIERAREMGLTEVYGLTSTAQTYLQSKGFSLVPRTDAPGCLEESDQFKELCPQTASLLKMDL